MEFKSRLWVNCNYCNYFYFFLITKKLLPCNPHGHERVLKEEEE